MIVYCAQEPAYHHYFTKTLNGKHTQASLLRFDNHSDYFSDEPCANYVYKVIDYFFSAVWVNKPDSKETNGHFLVYDYLSSPKALFKNLSELLSCLDLILSDEIIIDVDPDVINGYPCNFTTSLMHEDELSEIIKSVNSTKKINYAFFASPKGFAERILSNAGLIGLEFINLM